MTDDTKTTLDVIAENQKQLSEHYLLLAKILKKAEQQNSIMALLLEREILNKKEREEAEEESQPEPEPQIEYKDIRIGRYGTNISRRTVEHFHTGRQDAGFTDYIGDYSFRPRTINSIRRAGIKGWRQLMERSGRIQVEQSYGVGENTMQEIQLAIHLLKKELKHLQSIDPRDSSEKANA